MSKSSSWLLGAIGALCFAFPILGCEEACEEYAGVVICGELGEPSYATSLGSAAAEVSWPPVAIQADEVLLARGSELLRVDATGQVQPVASFSGELAIPSVCPDGAHFVLSSGPMRSDVTAFEGGDVAQGSSWSKTIDGRPAGMPPTLSSDRVMVATLVDRPWRNELYELDPSTGEVAEIRIGASPAAFQADGTMRYMSDPRGWDDPVTGGPVFQSLVAENSDGSVAWEYTPPGGLVEFSPGGQGETYVVTADHTLSKISSDGALEWTFSPPCDGCDVAAAPTVANDAIYFPVWRQATAEDTSDPLYALDLDGSLRWRWEGFAPSKSPFDTSWLMMYLVCPGHYPGMVHEDREGGEEEAYEDHEHSGDEGSNHHARIPSLGHHPLGRPAVAEDGTLFVSTPGAVTALSPEGKEIGRAQYEVEDTKRSRRSGSKGQLNSNNHGGATPSPVLATDGTLYVWDGATVRSFDTGKPAAAIPWMAPFGGPSNSGRVN